MKRLKRITLSMLTIAMLVMLPRMVWDLTTPAAGQNLEQFRRAPAYEDFDVRIDGSKASSVKLDRQRQKLTPQQKDKSENLGRSMREARERLSKTIPGLEVAYSRLIDSPEIVGVAGGRRFLTSGSNQPREQVVRGFINQNADLYGLSARQVAQLRKVADYTNPSGNLGWVTLEHRINGMRVFRGEICAALTPEGEIVRTIGESPAGLTDQELPTNPTFNAYQAVAIAAQSIGVTVHPGELLVKESSPDGRSYVFDSGPFAEDIKVELQYFPLKPGLATLSWSMVLWQEDPAYYMLVDAEFGDLLWRKNITSDQTQTATYSVYNGDSPAPLTPSNALPGSGIQGAAIPRTSYTLISEGPAFNNLGWITDGGNTTTGNNVDAGLDLVSPNGIDPSGRPTGSPFRVFDFAYNPAPGIPPPGQSPTLTDYRWGEVTNMFFWSNRYHDQLYQLGFTEPARNFQQNNFGRGGLGNDFVRAEAQDFSGTNNANFATPADGSLPRMQMYIFDGPIPNRTSGLDQEILIHELTHGTSNRLHNNAAGLTTTMSGGMGEGWSDFYALALLSEPADDPTAVYPMGGYSTLNIVAGFTDSQLPPAKPEA